MSLYVSTYRSCTGYRIRLIQTENTFTLVICQCFGTVYITLRIRIQVRIMLHWIRIRILHADPGVLTYCRTVRIRIGALFIFVRLNEVSVLVTKKPVCVSIIAVNMLLDVLNITHYSTCIVQDLLTTVNTPEWPAAELLLSVLGHLLVNKFANKGKQKNLYRTLHCS